MRNWRFSQWLAGALARGGVSPNSISVAGMVSGIAAGGTLAAAGLLPEGGQRLAWLAAAAFVQLRLLANMLDGMVAVEGGKVSSVGELYNEVPDRVSDAATLLGVGFAPGGDVVLGCLAACAALFTAYIRAMGKAAGATSQFCGPMAKQHRMFLVTLCALYIALTPTDWQPAWGLPRAFLILILVGSLLTALRRLRRVAGQLRNPSP
jgi:phosphatidylglycerophosphate synthase